MFKSLKTFLSEEDLQSLQNFTSIEELNNKNSLWETFTNIEGFVASECKNYVVGVSNKNDSLLLNFAVKFEPNNVSAFFDNVISEVKQTTKSQINRALSSFSTLTCDLVYNYCSTATTAFLNVNFTKSVDRVLKGEETLVLVR